MRLLLYLYTNVKVMKRQYSVSLSFSPYILILMITTTNTATLHLPVQHMQVIKVNNVTNFCVRMHSCLGECTMSLTLLALKTIMCKPQTHSRILMLQEKQIKMISRINNYYDKTLHKLLTSTKSCLC